MSTPVIFARGLTTGTHLTRLELFSRTPRAGWTSWGNETGKFEEERA